MHYSSFSGVPERRLPSAFVLVFSVFMIACSFVYAPAPAQAQEQEDCHLGTCDGIRIYNYTEYRYKMGFKLCCNHTVLYTDCIIIPADSEYPVAFPHNCQLLNWRFCDDLPDGVCYTWNPDECVMRIYYCP